jgi:hypothetical protein
MEYLCNSDFLCRVRGGGGPASHPRKYGWHQSVRHNHVRRIIWVSPEVWYFLKPLTDSLPPFDSWTPEIFGTKGTL